MTAPATPWVLLRHDLPDGSWHYDWMIAPAEPTGTARLICFRVTHRPDDPGVVRFDAERIAEHRRDYLSYEGPVSDGRSSVQRVARGTCRVVRDDAAFIVELIGVGGWKGERAGFESAWYRFERGAEGGT